MNPFKRVDVIVDPANAKHITWTMTTVPSSPVFNVEIARSGGNWRDVSGPLTNVCEYVDPVKYDWRKDRDVYYRVVMTGGTETVNSQPAKAGDGFLDKSDWLLYREIRRRTCMTFKSGATPGEFLRRKRWGTPCPNCLDYDTGEVANANCPTCLGTGFVGGYYESVKMNAIFKKGATSDKKVVPGAGTTDDQSRVAVVMAPPYPDSMDIWMSLPGNDRYVVRKVTPAASFKGLVISVSLELLKLPYSSSSMDIPVEASSHNDPAAKDNGWRPNLNNEY